MRFSFSMYIHETEFLICSLDLMGPLSDLSFSGDSYMLKFINDISCKMWAYFLNKKSHFFHLFEEWKIMVVKIDNGMNFF